MANAVAAPSAHELVQDTTNRLLADLAANKEKYKQDPQDFYAALNSIVGPVVDAEGISKSIMTVKYSRKATPAQMKTFEENFKKGLFQFYGNALLEYNNQGITVDPAKDESGNRTSVGMTVKGSNGAIYPVSYTLEKVGGEWKLRNVIINGINIGKLFRDQFADAMQRNGNDLDKTINGWAGESAVQIDDAGELRLSGVLDYRTGPQLREQGQALIKASKAAAVVVDCSAVEKSSSVGLSLLLCFMRDAQAAGKALSIRGMPEDMREIAQVSELTELLSMQANEVKSFLEGKLPGTKVEVEGEGCNFQLNVISDELAALSPVKRQQQVYAHLNPWITDGSIHAVTMKFFSSAAWAERT
eukprot:gene6907-6758_t